MEQRSATGDDHFVEDTYLAPQFGMLEFLRRLREDQLSVLVPELFGRNLVSFNHLFLHGFLINKPEYIEHVLLTNHSNYSKSRFLRRVLGPLLGEGLLISEGEFWRRTHWRRQGSNRGSSPPAPSRKYQCARGRQRTSASQDEGFSPRAIPAAGVSAQMLSHTIDIMGHFRGHS
jgi:hypothetical protein